MFERSFVGSAAAPESRFLCQSLSRGLGGVAHVESAERWIAAPLPPNHPSHVPMFPDMFFGGVRKGARGGWWLVGLAV